MDLGLAMIAGLLIGAVLGFVGAGGSMVTVPLLIYGFSMSPVQATTASLVVVFSAALSGVIPKLKKNEVLVKESLVIWSIGLITNLGGAYILPKLPESIVLTGFAFVLMSAGTSMLLKPIENNASRHISPMALIVISLIIGAMTGLFGIGGGFLAIPILVLFYNVSPARAAGTSLFIITINTITGFFAHYRHWGDVDWKVPIVMAVVAVIVSRLASHRSSQVSSETLKRAFALLVFGIAIFTLVETWLLK